MRTRQRNLVINPSPLVRLGLKASVTRDAKGNYVSHTMVENTNSPTSVSIPSALTTRKEVISDTQEGRDAINTVSHTRSEPPDFASCLLLAPSSISYGDLGNGYVKRYTSAMRPAMDVPVGCFQYNHGTGTLNASNLSAAQSLPVSSRQGELPGQVIRRLEGWHGGVFVLELQDMPKLASLWGRRGNLMQLLTNPPWGRGLKAFRAWGRNAKNAHLANEYGILPTIRDLHTLYSEFTRIRERSTEFSVCLRGEKETSSEWIGPARGKTNDPWNQVERRDRLHTLRIDGVHVRAKKGAPSLDAPLTKQWRKYIGLNPAAQAWDLCPLSFIVDSFLGIGDLLDNLWLRYNPYVECQYWYSLKDVNEVSFTCHVPTELVPEIYLKGTAEPVKRYEESVQSFRNQVSKYVRAPILQPPTLVSSLGFGGLSYRSAMNYFLVSIGLLPSRRR